VRSEKTEIRDGKNESCSVVHCGNPPVTDGYCDTHLERLELIKEAHGHVKQMQLRAREDEKGSTIESNREAAPSFGQPEEYIE
jgi:hypothetical protein